MTSINNINNTDGSEVNPLLQDYNFQDQIKAAKELAGMDFLKSIISNNLKSATGDIRLGRTLIKNRVSAQNARQFVNSPHTNLDVYDVSPRPNSGKLSANIAMKGVKQALELTPIPYLNLAEFTNADVNAVLAAHIYPFFDGSHDIEITNLEVYFGSWISLMMSLGCASSEAVINQVLIPQDIKVTLLPCNNRNEYLTAMNEFYNPEEQYFEEYLAAARVSGELVFEHLLINFNLSCLLLGKCPIEKYFTDYQKKRIRAAAQVIGSNDDEMSYKITYKGASNAYSKISSAFLFRRWVFNFLVSHAKGSPFGKFGQMCKLSVKLLAFTDMTHVYLILNFLVNKFPEFLSLRILNDGDIALQKMINLLKRLGDDAPYARILYPEEECEDIHRDRLKTHTVVATAVAKYTDTSYQNYNIPSSIFKVQVERTVQYYIQQRTELFKKAVIVNPHAGANDLEKGIYLLQAMQEKEFSFEAPDLNRM